MFITQLKRLGSTWTLTKWYWKKCVNCSFFVGAWIQWMRTQKKKSNRMNIIVFLSTDTLYVLTLRRFGSNWLISKSESVERLWETIENSNLNDSKYTYKRYKNNEFRNWTDRHTENHDHKYVPNERMIVIRIRNHNSRPKETYTM